MIGTKEIHDELVEELKQIEAKVEQFTLADAIRLGSSKTTQHYGWGHGENACALTAAVIAANAYKDAQ